MSAILIEEYVLALLTGNITAWVYTAIFTASCMKLASLAGKATANRLFSVGDMADVNAHSLHDQAIPDFVCWDCAR